MSLTLLGVAFAFGALTILAVEVVGLFIFIHRLNKRIVKDQHKVNDDASQTFSLDHGRSDYKKQGLVWILESEKILKFGHVGCDMREPKRKKEMLEVFPIQKYARINNHSLFISESDGCHTEVQLTGCVIEAVSASNSPSRKWAKRYPIRVESKKSKLYKGSNVFYIYLETSSEKEAWCKALRVASCNDKEKWFSKLNLEFRRYVASLNAEYPSFMKPSTCFSIDPKDNSVKIDGSSSKVRQFLRKLAKKASKNGIESKGNWASVAAQDDKRINVKSHSFQDFGSACVSASGQPSMNVSVSSVPLSSADLGSEGQSSVTSDADYDDRISSNEGTLACNMLLSRLFFDAKSDVQLKKLIQARIQRMLSNMRSPSFIGAITCTDVDPGNIPPYIHGIRVLPSSMNELWLFEIDIEYAGGAILDVETRLEVQEQDSKEGKDPNLESSALDEVPTDLIEDFENIGKQLNLSEAESDDLVQRDDRESAMDGIGSDKSTMRASSQVSRWKTMFHAVAKQVSQVPLSLGIRVSSLRGTLRVSIKPPPSDQIWFGFTSMPDIHFDLGTFVGDRKITSGRLALFLISRFKVAIRETLVLPNSESMYIPWMLAEKDDWVPRKVAPFLWIKQELAPNSTSKPGSTQPVKENNVAEGTSRSNVGDEYHSLADMEHARETGSESSDLSAIQPAPLVQSTLDDCQLVDLITPLLKIDESGETSLHNGQSHVKGSSSSQSPIQQDKQNHVVEGEDGKLKRVGTKARMLGFGKKVGEKLEEKRRHIEERGRHIVERMKGP